MGELTKKGESRPATTDDLRFYEQAQAMQAMQDVPVLQRTGNLHEYLFFALFDGTGQDVNNSEQLPTNVGVLSKQAELLARDPSNRIGHKYVEGIGTQRNFFARGRDGLLPYTWDDKLEEAYRALANQTKEWKEQDPQAQVRIAEVGYSRGAVLGAGLARLVDRYGIADPEGLRFGRDAQGGLTVESRRPPLMAPGQVAQAMGLYDPVATNMPRDYDARRAPSVISAMALAARDEDRVKFPHQTILEPGLSQDRRFANLLVPGGHSNVGGGNRDYGLETGAFNVMADYLNGLRDEPLFQYRALPADPALYTVYQARGPTAVPGMDQDELRDLRLDLANCKIVDPCREGEPMNRALADRFEYRRLQPAAPVPMASHLQPQAAPTIAGSQAQNADETSNVADAAARQSLHHASLMQQLQHQDAQAGGRETGQVRKAGQEPRAGNESRDHASLQPFSHPDHPQHALYADVQQRFAVKGHALSEAQLSVLTRRMHATGYAPGWPGDVTVRGEQAFVGSFHIGSRMTSVALNAPAPSVQETMKDFQADQQSMAQSMDMLRQQQAAAQEHGHGLSR